jgi:CIC family chloride channel protein
LEVVLPGFTPSLLIPLLISSAAGKILFELIMGENLRFDVHINEFSYQSLPYVIIIGIAGVLTATYMVKAYSFCFRKLARLGNPWVIALAGGSVLGALILFFPSLYGEGYVSINKLLHGQEPMLWKHSFLANPIFQPFNGLILIFVLLLLRPITTGLSLASGGEGGYFAPSLVAGGLVGYLVFKTVFVISGDLAGLAPNTFVFLGMAATFACVMRAPVTAIFLIADTTESYAIIVPLMIVTAVAYTVKNYFDKVNPLVSAGHGTLQMEKFIINQINMNDIIEPIKDFVDEEDKLRNIIEHFSVYEHAIVPVINTERKVVGIIELKTLRTLLKDFETYDIKTAKEIMDTDFEVVEFTALRKKLSNKPSIIKEEHLLVQKNNQVMAYVSKYKLLTIYNQYLSNPDLLFSK